MSKELAMFEILFVIGFFIMLMVTGISLLGIFAALLVAAAFMMVGGLFVMMIKLLPWLVLAIVVVWLWRSMQKPTVRRY
jgi:phage shock protein G